MWTLLRPSLVFLGLLTLITGVLYPALVTGVAQVFFPFQANGSLLVDDGTVRGSLLIGQPFDDPRYFWSRPSATGPYPYHAGASSGSNLGPTSPALQEAVAARVAALRAADSTSAQPIPVDLVTASASGLDPHLSPAAALYQVPRVARARSLPVDSVQALVQRYTQGRTGGLLGEPRVSVLALNQALDARFPEG